MGYPKNRKSKWRNMSVAERLKSCVKVAPNGCWEWQKYRGPKGYGQINIDGRILSTHRLSYQTFVGPIPNELCVLHRCDNSSCINPDHLWLGTKLDNNRDMHTKGRQAVGDDLPQASLSSEQVLSILNKNPRGWDEYREIAKRYEVSWQTIWRIVTRRNWKHLHPQPGRGV